MFSICRLQSDDRYIELSMMLKRRVLTLSMCLIIYRPPCLRNGTLLLSGCCFLGIISNCVACLLSM